MTTAPDLNRYELCRTPLRANDMGTKCLRAPSDCAQSRFPGVGAEQQNSRLGDSLLGCPRVSISSCERGVAVTVAVHCSTPATFQAFTSDLLCAQDFCKLLVKREFQDLELLTVDDS